MDTGLLALIGIGIVVLIIAMNAFKYWTRRKLRTINTERKITVTGEALAEFGRSVVLSADAAAVTALIEAIPKNKLVSLRPGVWGTARHVDARVLGFAAGAAEVDEPRREADSGCRRGGYHHTTGRLRLRVRGAVEGHERTWMLGARGIAGPGNAPRLFTHASRCTIIEARESGATKEYGPCEKTSTSATKRLSMRP
jgi:hypothetical protein